MANEPYDMFAEIADARATGAGNGIKDGIYTLAITDAKYENKNAGLTWITEFVVVAATPIPGNMERGGEACTPDAVGAIQVVPNAIGSKVSFVAPVGNPQIPNAKGNVKAFMLALSNTSEAAFNAAEAEAKKKRIVEEAQGVPLEKRTPSPFGMSCMLITGPQQVMRGALIRCTTIRKTNKGNANAANKGKVMVMPSWQHMPHVPAEIAARRALIEQGLPIPWSAAP